MAISKDSPLPILCARLCLLALAAPLPGAAPLAAQVGHPPDASPYRDMRESQFLSFSGGYVAGGAGEAGVGPANGRVGGVRVDLRLGGPAYVSVGVLGGAFERVIIDPTLGPVERIQDTVSQSVIIGDAGLMLVLTGQKTWRGVAPYLGASLGLAFGGQVPADSVSNFQFATRFQLGPQVGLRWHTSERVHLRFEARDLIWRLSYPPRFFDAPLNDPEEPPVLDRTVSKRTEWAHHPTLFISLGYALRL